LGETKKPHTNYGWDEFVSPLNFYISNKIFHGSYGGAHRRLKPRFPVKGKERKGTPVAKAPARRCWTVGLGASGTM